MRIYQILDQILEKTDLSDLGVAQSWKLKLKRKEMFLTTRLNTNFAGECWCSVFLSFGFDVYTLIFWTKIIQIFFVSEKKMILSVLRLDFVQFWRSYPFFHFEIRSVFSFCFGPPFILILSVFRFVFYLFCSVLTELFGFFQIFCQFFFSKNWW